MLVQMTAKHFPLQLEIQTTETFLFANFYSTFNGEKPPPAGPEILVQTVQSRTGLYSAVPAALLFCDNCILFCLQLDGKS